MMSLLDPGKPSRFHLSENVLTCMASRGLPSVQRLLATKHIDGYSKCRDACQPKVCATLHIVETISQLRAAAFTYIPNQARP
jgi:hypothetical protein